MPASQGAGRGDNVVLFVGSLFTRRHVGELIEGFARLARRQPDVRLEIVGDNRTNPRVDFTRLRRMMRPRVTMKTPSAGVPRWNTANPAGQVARAA